MDKIIISPSKYVQGSGVINKAAIYLKPLGNKPLAIMDHMVVELVAAPFDSAIKKWA